MSAAWMVARAGLRRRWRSIVVIALVVGIAGAAVLAALAGARRTSSALDRFEQYSKRAQFEVATGTTDQATIERFEHIPGVIAVAELHGFTMALPDGTFLPLAAAVDGRFGRVVDRARVIAGRLPHRSAPLELAIGETLADRLDVHVGSKVKFVSYSSAQIARSIQTNSDPGDPQGPTVSFKVVGIVRRPLDLGVRGGPGGVVVPTPAFYREYRDRIGDYSGEILRVRARTDAADSRRIVTAARRLFGSSFAFSIMSLSIETEGANDAIDVLAIALWIFAGITLIAGLVTVAIIESRQVAVDDGDQRVLSALGLTRGQRALGAAAVAIPISALGTAIALVTAAALSPLLPFGLARKADVDAGFHVDVLVFVVGAIGIFAAVLIIGATAGWRVAGLHARGPATRPSTAARVAAASGLNPPVTVGLELATERGRDRRTVPVRSAFVGAVVGVAGVTAMLVFSACLTNLVASPALFGWSFDAVVRPSATPTAAETAAAQRCSTANVAAVRDPQFSAFGVACLLSVDVDGRAVEAWGFRSLRGSIEPAVLGGRQPRGSHEVVLGHTTLTALGKHIGDTVLIRERDAPRRFKIVGTATFPSPLSFDAQALSDGVAITITAIRQLAADPNDLNANLVVRFAPGVDVAKLPRARASRGEVPKQDLPLIRKAHAGIVVLPNLPVEIARLEQVDTLPYFLAAIVALLSLAAVAHAIALSGSRRRHELAVLRTLGFRRGQVRAVMFTQATTHAVLGLVFGMPLGIALGRTLWNATARNVGVTSVIVVPGLALVATVLGTLAVANVLGAVGAIAALHRKPAVVLRSE